MTSPPVALDTPRAHPSVETAFLVPEAVLFDARHGETHHLNSSASAVWMLIDGESTVDQIAADISEIFSVPYEQTRNDVLAAVDDFRARGLLDGERSEPREEAVDPGLDAPSPEPERLSIVTPPPNP